MRKLILSVVMMLAFITINAQWVEKIYVDEFGDKTGETYKKMVAPGVFSNTATQNSKAFYAFIDGGSSLLIDVYEYEKNLATSTNATFETVRVKTPSGEIVTFTDAFFTKTGGLFISDDYKLFMSTIKAPGKYTIIFNKTGTYSTSKYRIKLEIK